MSLKCVNSFLRYLAKRQTNTNEGIVFLEEVKMCYLESGQAIESRGVNCFRRDIGDVCYKFLQIPAGLLQVGCVNNDLHQLQ